MVYRVEHLDVDNEELRVLCSGRFDPWSIQKDDSRICIPGICFSRMVLSQFPGRDYDGDVHGLQPDGTHSQDLHATADETMRALGTVRWRNLLSMEAPVFVR